MIPTPNEYFALTTKSKKQKVLDIRIATVFAIALDGEPILIFPAEKLPDQKADYKRMKHYLPEIGDSVMLINNVIIGGWRP